LNKKINYKRVIILLIVVGILISIGRVFYKIIYLNKVNNSFVSSSEKYLEEIENPVFQLEKIYLYSDANIEDLSENNDLSDINISQFTDFSIYINNRIKYQELTAENTINKISISDIEVTPLSYGDQKVYYKNINEICKYKPISFGVNSIEYTVIHSNDEKEKNSEDNIFFTDCSEPLIMSYVNENIVEHKDMSNSNRKLSLDGSMLKYLGIGLNNLNYKISFKINIENNLGENYECKYTMDVNLNSDEGGIYTGYIMQIYDMSTLNYKFRKVDNETKEGK